MALLPETADTFPFVDYHILVNALNGVIGFTTVDYLPFGGSQIEPVYVSDLDTAAARPANLATPVARTIPTLPLSPLRVSTYMDQDLEVRGTVLDEDSLPLDREVIIIQRDGIFLGKTRSSSVDGSFSLICRDYGAQRVVVLAVPVEADLRNAVVKWGVIPVTRA